MTSHFDPDDVWDNLHGPSAPNLHSSTDNVGEAAPGVLSPLGAALLGEVGESGTRGSLVAMGVLPASEAGVPSRLEDRYVRIFCGRIAAQVELLTAVGDRLPGASGREIAKALLGTVPEDIEYHSTRQRYPAIAWKLSRTFLGMPARLARETPAFHRFWRTSIDALEGTDLASARRILRDALRQFEAAVLLQCTAVSGHANLMFQALAGVIQQAGVGDMGVLSGAGGAEMAVIIDIWKASRGEMTVEQVVREHGFHGPLEGEVSSRVCREDPTPLNRLIGDYADREDPRIHEVEMKRRLPAAQAEVLAALPRLKRPGAKVVLDMAAKRTPLRGVAKRSFLEGLDVIRACARRIGASLAEAGELGTPDDAFYLTKEELLDLPCNAATLQLGVSAVALSINTSHSLERGKAFPNRSRSP
jgi:rifampicin phosphotransferase